MAGPGGPVNDLIMQLIGAAESRLGARPSPELANRMRNIEALGQLPGGPSPNVLPMTRGPSQDPWFDDLMSQAEAAGGLQGVSSQSSGVPGELFIWVTSPSGRKTRLDGPYTDLQEAITVMESFGRDNPRFQLSVGTLDNPDATVEP